MVRTKTLMLLASLALATSCTATMAADQGEAQLRSPLPAGVGSISPERIRRDQWIARRLAKYEWVDKIAEADPRIVAAICAHPGPARLLAMHRHIDKVAEADKYTCRRLCQWEGATQKLLRNPYCDKVVEADPEGMYWAMQKKPEYTRVLSKHQVSWDMTNMDRNLGREIQKHMK